MGDIFRRSDLAGLGRTGWLIFTILVPFLGVFIYVVSQNDGMTQREIDGVRARQERSDDHVRSTAERKLARPDAERESTDGQTISSLSPPR